MIRLFSILLLCATLYPSNSYSQEILIPYRIGEFWGMADTFGKLVIEPVYQRIITNPNYPKGYYFTFVNKKFGLVSSKGILMQPVHSSMSFENRELIREQVLMDNNGKPIIPASIYYNLQGEKIMEDTLYILERSYREFPYYNVFKVRSKNGDNGWVYLDKETKKLKQWIYKSTDEITYLDFKYKDTTWSVQTMQYNPQKVKVKFTFRYDKNLDSFIVERPSEILVVQEEKHLEKKVDVEENEMMNFQEENIKLKEWDEQNEFQSIIKRYRYFVRNDSLHMVETHYTKSKYAIVKNGFEKIHFVHMAKQEKTEIIMYFNPMRRRGIGSGYWVAEDTSVLGLDFVVRRGRNSLKITSEFGTFEVDADTVYGLPGMNYTRPTFLVGKYDKKRKERLFGIVDAKGNWILERMYQDIRLAHKPMGDYLHRIIVTEEGGQKVLNKLKEVSKSYIKAIPTDLSFTSFNLLDSSGMYSYLGFDRMNNTYLSVPFKFKVYSKVKLNGMTMWKFVDSKKELIGYGDNKGILYFREK